MKRVRCTLTNQPALMDVDNKSCTDREVARVESVCDTFASCRKTYWRETLVSADGPLARLHYSTSCTSEQTAPTWRSRTDRRSSLHTKRSPVSPCDSSFPVTWPVLIHRVPSRPTGPTHINHVCYCNMCRLA